tara:strand:- start:620 stop:841 length:222 start_codon:yes stop_codon:yes gene_type:complete
MENYKIEGHGDLARDPETNSIVNINSSDYNQYVSRKKLNEKKNRKEQTIEEDLTKLKDEIQEIKLLLKELLIK